jgi:hypothetical protein
MYMAGSRLMRLVILSVPQLFISGEQQVSIMVASTILPGFKKTYFAVSKAVMVVMFIIERMDRQSRISL